jgi:hypothetical protein
MHQSVEERIEALEIQMKDLQPKLEDMYFVFNTTRNGLRMLGKIGDGVMYVSDHVEKRPKTLLIAGVLSAGGYSFITTGKLPDWIMDIARALIS